MHYTFSDESKEKLVKHPHELTAVNIEKALVVLNNLFEKNFIKDMIEHATYIETLKEFFPKIKDPYGFIKLRIKNEAGLGEDYLALNNALPVLREAQIYIKNLPYFSNDPIKKYHKAINQDLKFISPHIAFIKKVVEFHLVNVGNKETLQKKDSYRFLRIV